MEVAKYLLFVKRNHIFYHIQLSHREMIVLAKFHNDNPEIVVNICQQPIFHVVWFIHGNGPTPIIHFLVTILESFIQKF